MATSTEEILLRLGLDGTGVTQGLNAMTKSVESKMASFGKTIAQAFSAGSILSGINSVIDKFDDLQDRADNLGVGTDFLQGVGQIAKQNAVGGIETFNRAITELSTKLGDAKTGGDQAIKTFQKYGITLQQIDSLNAEQMFYLISDTIARIPDPAQRTAAAFDLMGKAGKNLSGVMSEGSENLKKMSDQVDKLDERRVKMLADAKDKIEEFKNATTIGAAWMISLIGDAAAGYGRISIGLDDLKKSMQEEELQGIEKIAKAQAEAAEAQKQNLTTQIKLIRDLAYESSAVQSFQIGDKIFGLMRQIKGSNFQTVSVEDLAGREFSKQRAAMYGEGGQFDLGKGTGKFRLVAQEYIAAEYAQKYARAYGTPEQAQSAQDRMNKAGKILEQYGVKAPGADVAAMRGELEGLRADLQNLTAVATGDGIKVKTD